MKVDAIKQAPQPVNVEQLRAFIGLVNFYGKFIPNISLHLQPLYALLQKDAHWNWNANCTAEFTNCKAALTSTELLVHYDVKRPIRLSCDACTYGLGAVLSHVIDGQERPVAYASRLLTKAEKNYAQIDKEALAIVFGVKRFHKYLYGRRFTLVTDHKPLTSLLSPTAAVPPIAAARLQRWSLALAAYMYDISYRKGCLHGNADGLSRLPVSEDTWDPDSDGEYAISFVEELPVSSTDIAAATADDPVVSQVYRFVMEGWPSHNVDDALTAYFIRKDNLITDQGCLVWGMRVVIPASLRSRLLNELHSTHSGVVKMKSVARSYFWWPSMDRDIEGIASHCSSCLEHRNVPCATPLQHWPWSNRPMQRVHVDFAEIEGQHVLVLIDAHSKWIEAILVGTATTASTIHVLRNVFASTGIPEQLVSDNGPQFTSLGSSNFAR